MRNAGANAQLQDEQSALDPQADQAAARRQDDDEAQEQEQEQPNAAPPYEAMQQHAMAQDLAAPPAAEAEHEAAHAKEDKQDAAENDNASETESSRSEEPTEKPAEPAAVTPQTEPQAESQPPAAEASPVEGEALEAEVADTEIGQQTAEELPADEAIDAGAGGSSEAKEHAQPVAADAGVATGAEQGERAIASGERAAAEVAAPPAVEAKTPAPRPRPRASAEAVADAQADVDASVATEHGAITSQFAQQRSEIEATTAVQQVIATTNGITRYAQMLGDLAQRENLAKGIFESARAGLRGTAAVQAGIARQDAADAVQRFRDDAAKQRAAAHAHADLEGKRMTETGRAQGRRIITSSRRTIDVVKVQAEDAIKTADLIEDEGDREAAKSALRKTKNDTKDKLLDTCLSDHDKLVELGQKNHAKLTDSATKLFKDQDRGIEEIEAEILLMGAKIAFRIELQAKTQLYKIDEAERRYLAELNILRRRAAEVITAGTSVARMIGDRGRRQVAILKHREGVALAQLDRAGHTAHGQLAEHDELPRSVAQKYTSEVRTQLTAARTAHLAEAATAHAVEQGELAASGAAFGARADQQRAALVGQVDAGLGTVATSLADSTTAFQTQCVIDRTTAINSYNQVFIQFISESWSKLGEAKAEWTAKADEFGAESTSRADDQISRHAQLVEQLPAKLEGVSKETVSNRHKSWIRRKLENAWKHFKSFLKGLVILIVVIGLSIVISPLILIAFVGFMVFKSAIARFSALFDTWDDWSTAGKVFGVIGTVFAVVGDVFGVTYFFEGIFESEAVTGRDLSDEEASERFWHGFYSILLIFAVKGASNKWGPGPRTGRPPAGELPPGERPALPPGETPVETVPAERPPVVEETPVAERPPVVEEQPPATERPPPAEERPPTAEEQPQAPSRELGLRDAAERAIERLENIKADPVGEVNSQPNHNHYSAARREAAGEVVARRPDGRPYSHIGDLQRGYDGLARVERTLRAEVDNPPDTITERGIDVLLKKHSEVQSLMNRLNGFLSEIGHGRFPPYHEFPPGT